MKKCLRTKQILILTDGKVGHEKQSLAIAQYFPNADVQTVRISYRSSFRYIAFSLLIPWISGRSKQALKWVLTPESYSKVHKTSPNIIIATGSKLNAVTIALSKWKQAKNIVVMEPSWGRWNQYDLLFIPKHDHPPKRSNIIPIPFPPVFQVKENLSDEILDFQNQFQLNAKKYISVFLGGPNAVYTYPKDFTENLIQKLKNIYENEGSHFLITTSRRTPDWVSEQLKEKLKAASFCDFLWIAGENPTQPKNLVQILFELSERSLVTSDSISMISEAVASQKPVSILALKEKRRFFRRNKFRDFLNHMEILRASGAQDDTFQNALDRLL